MEGQIEEEVKQARLKRLMSLQKAIAQHNSEQLVGKTLEILIESQDGLSGVYHGRGIHSAPDGIDGTVYVHSLKPLEPGQFVMALITKARGHDLVAEVQ